MLVKPVLAALCQKRTSIDDDEGFTENDNKDHAYRKLVLGFAVTVIFTTSMILFAYQSAKATCSAFTNVPLYKDARAFAESSNITKVRSGLVAYETFTTDNLKSWTLYGSAIPRESPYAHNITSAGLYLGIQAAVSGLWAGYFAESPSTDAYLFHAVLTLPYARISDYDFNTGLYVQTTYKGLVNYVTCVANVNPSGYYWSIVQAEGSPYGAESFTTLWQDNSSNQPLTRDCTIITDGEHFLQVFLDGVRVYSNSALKLNMPAPFYAFVEVQTSSSSEMRYARYTDYYATLNNALTVANAPIGAIVTIIDSSTDKEIAKGIVGQDGVARLDIGKYHMPIRNAYIKIYDQDSKESMYSSKSDLWAGDLYSVGAGQLKNGMYCLPITNV